MTAEQLQAARAAHWRQQQNPILTLDDATHWLEQHPLCLYLPRRAQLPAPAPSFVEATLGTAAATPATSAMAPAQALLTRLLESGSVVALNLFGAVGEQPDFLVARQALPYVLCLRADADWKHAPEKSSGHKVSPLVLELWKALDKDGALTAAEARETLGRELTEAAVLRGLGELWQGLRISPVWAQAGQPARWELLRVRHRDALATAAATGQVTALSLLVSIYLQSVYAASGEEIEIFLSPLASRSRVREAVRGLSATRQIHSLSMEAQTYYFLEGGLPEFAESAAPMAAHPPLPGPPAVHFSTPPRPLPRTAPGKEQRVRPAGPEWKKPQRAEQPLTAPPAFPPARSFPPAPQPGAKIHRDAQRSSERRAARPGPGAGSETRPARPQAGKEWRKPAWPGKPARPSAPGAVRTSRGPRNDAEARSGGRPGKHLESRPEKPRGERSAPWARPGAKPPFRSTGPGSNRPDGQARDGGRPDGPVSSRPAGTPPTGRPAGPRPASFRPRPGSFKPGSSRTGPTKPGSFRTGSSRTGPTKPGSFKAGSSRTGPPRTGSFKAGSSRTGPPRPGSFKTGSSRTGPPRQGSFKTGSSRTGPPRTGPTGPGRSEGARAGGQTPRSGFPGSRPPRPSAPREGDGQPSRPPFVPASRPSKPWLRTGSPSARPSGQPGSQSAAKQGGKPSGRTGGKSGGKSGKPPGDFPRRKPARKKPGA